MVCIIYNMEFFKITIIITILIDKTFEGFPRI